MLFFQILLVGSSYLPKQKLVVIVPRATFEDFNILNSIRMHYFYRSFTQIYHAIIQGHEEVSHIKSETNRNDDYYETMHDKYTQLLNEYMKHFLNKNSLNAENPVCEQTQCSMMSNAEWIFAEFKAVLADSYYQFTIYLENLSDTEIDTFNIESDKHLYAYYKFVSSYVFAHFQNENGMSVYHQSLWNEFIDQLNKDVIYLTWHNLKTYDVYNKLDEIFYDSEIEYVETTNFFDSITPYLVANENNETRCSILSVNPCIYVDITAFYIEFFISNAQILTNEDNDLSGVNKSICTLVSHLNLDAEYIETIENLSNIMGTFEMWEYKKHEVVNLLISYDRFKENEVAFYKSFGAIHWLCTRYFDLLKTKIYRINRPENELELQRKYNLTVENDNDRVQNHQKENESDLFDSDIENVEDSINCKLNRVINDFDFFCELNFDGNKMELIHDFIFQRSNNSIKKTFECKRNEREYQMQKIQTGGIHNSGNVELGKDSMTGKVSKYEQLGVGDEIIKVDNQDNPFLNTEKSDSEKTSQRSETSTESPHVEEVLPGGQSEVTKCFDDVQKNIQKDKTVQSFYSGKGNLENDLKEQYSTESKKIERSTKGNEVSLQKKPLNGYLN